jgi:hypothetical protein
MAYVILRFLQLGFFENQALRPPVANATNFHSVQNFYIRL